LQRKKENLWAWGGGITLFVKKFDFGRRKENEWFIRKGNLRKIRGLEGGGGGFKRGTGEGGEIPNRIRGVGEKTL